VRRYLWRDACFALWAVRWSWRRTVRICTARHTPPPLAEETEPIKLPGRRDQKPSIPMLGGPGDRKGANQRPGISLIPEQPADGRTVPARQEVRVSRFATLLDESQTSAEHEPFRVTIRPEDAFTIPETAGGGARGARRSETRSVEPAKPTEGGPDQQAGTNTAGGIRGRRPKRTVVATLASKGSRRFAGIMRSAEKLLRQGRFYDAIDVFQRARQLKPEDALPLLGQSHALIAAGELRSAAVVLADAIDRFPTVLYLRLDGGRLLGSKTIVDRRVNQVRERMKHVGDKQFLLLAGYVELLAGHRERAIEAFEQAGVVEPRTPSAK